jgi:uncharacterized SAM-binding protein YcdF (DUF218 family)
MVPLTGLLLFWLTLPGAAPPDVVTDGAVILTGGTGRLGRGADILAAGRTRRLLVSGVDAKVRPAELQDAMGLDAALFARAVDLDFAADNTRANAREIGRWARRHQLRSIRVITSDYHAPRALGEIRAAVPEDTRLVVDAVPAEADAGQLVREFAKLLASRARLALGR